MTRSDARKRNELLPITVPAAEWGRMAERATNAELEAAHLRETLGAALILLSRTEDAFRIAIAERDGWQRDAAEHAARAAAAGYRLNGAIRERDAARDKALAEAESNLREFAKARFDKHGFGDVRGAGLWDAAAHIAEELRTDRTDD